MNDEIEIADPQALSEEELHTLGLSEHPFMDHAQEAYLYTDSHLEMTTNIIMEYLANPASTIVLTGENGLGKTTFLRKVLRLGYQQFQFCTLRASSDTDFNFIENKIKQRWVLDDTNEHSSITDLSIENYVISYLREHTHAVLIIDDAHLLDQTTLDRLFTLKHRIGLACPTSLGLILAGEGTLKTIISDLEDSNPACTQVYQINIRPLSHEQTKNYIEHRLDVAGFHGDVLFDDAKITEIYKKTSGNVKQIHEQAISFLQEQCNEGSIDPELNPSIAVRRPKPKAPVLFLTILVLIGLGLFINYRLSDDTTKKTAIPLDKPTSEPTLSPIAQESHKPKDKQTPSLPLPNTPKATNEHIEITNTQTVDGSVSTQKKSDKTKQDLPSLLAESIESLDKTQLSGLEKQLNELQHNDLSTGNETSESNQTVKATTEDVSKQESKKSQRTPTHGRSWLKALDPAHYTLQVVAAKDIKRIESLVKQEKLKEEYAYFKKLVKGSTYYVLVVGDYSNRDEALKAINSLPQTLSKNKPWPVSIKDVQQFVK